MKNNKFEMVRNIRLDLSDVKTKKEEFKPYPWEDCVADQMERYGDEEIAKRICGWIKANYATDFQEGDSLENACWEGWTAIGLKPSADGTRLVPNCVKDEQQSKQDFKIPKPESNEDENTFISRCMSDLNAEFPDESQRAAVCYKSWRGE